ncbi:venom protease-like [Diabrotica undecimpunctata]|uniref:venom protease-like n=1 Tax=Diabrotica undecimpunctata TaxID=50387 RepID=UPI003B63ADBF
MAFIWCIIYVLVFDVTEILSDASECSEDSTCVPLSLCNHARSSYVFYSCHNGLNSYCCPFEGVNQTTAEIFSRRQSVFPPNCGVVLTENKITGGETADLGQFPWMALLGYQQNQLNFIEYLCGGTLITETFVLTAAHCLGVGPNHQLVQVRFGEHDLNTELDCKRVHSTYICSDEPVDVPVLTYFIHGQYDTLTLKNDIALVKLAKSVTFTDYIQPICLPFERNLEHRDLTGQKLTISGWGKTDSRKLGGSPVLQFATVYVWDHKLCNQVVPPEVQPIIYSQLCANGKKQDACKGDSGGPLVNSTIDLDGELRNYQIGIVSFASTVTCGVEDLPPIYTRVDRYLKWILNIVENNQ